MYTPFVGKDICYRTQELHWKVQVASVAEHIDNANADNDQAVGVSQNPKAPFSAMVYTYRPLSDDMVASLRRTYIL